MGWISPKGEFHEMGSDDDHHEVIGHLTGVHPKSEDDYDTSKEHAYNKGWISVGHSGEFNFQAHKNVIANKNHPAMKTLRGLSGGVAENNPEETHLEAYVYDPEKHHSSIHTDVNHFLRHGTIKHDRSFGKSETKKPKLMGSAGSLDQIKGMIGKFYFSNNISLKDNGDGTHAVHNAKGPVEGVHVREHKGRYRFESKSDELKKGVKSRLFPFNPQTDVEPDFENTSDLKDWVEYGRSGELDFNDIQQARENIEPMNPQAKQRGLVNLSSKTKTRIHPQTGERQFLLHRGMSRQEISDAVGSDHVSHASRSSWTANPETAKNFARPKFLGGLEYLPDAPIRNRGRRVSAWINAKDIVHIPHQYGGIDKYGNPGQGRSDYPNEQEVIVDPHTSELAPMPKQSTHQKLHERVSNNPKSTSGSTQLALLGKLPPEQAQRLISERLREKLGVKDKVKGFKQKKLESNKKLAASELIKGLKLEHYSPQQDLKEIDPKFMGSGADKRTKGRSSEVPYSFYYRAGTPQPEEDVGIVTGKKYHIEIPEDAKLYDVGADPEGHMAKLKEESQNRQINPGVVSWDDKHHALKDMGYHGFFDSTHPTLGNVVGLYHSQPVDKVSKSNICESSLAKSHEKSMASKGLALLYPVSVMGNHMRSNGIPHHVTVKFFDKPETTPEQAHEYSSREDLPAPDPKQIGVTPKVFQNRFGEDVHVLALHGPGIDHLKESNARGAHLGLPTSYSFTPHISVDKETHDKVASLGKPTSAAELGIEFGKPELRRGPDVLARYGKNR
jgi:hypothetical protein